MFVLLMYWCLCSGGDLLLFMCLYGVYVVMYWCLHVCVADVLVFML